MNKKCVNDIRCAVADSSENNIEVGEDDEALSLSDLPIIHLWRNQKESNDRPIEDGNKDDFDFCSLSKESEMCAADEVFFQGQILPLRHSVSSASCCRSVSRSESMDHYSSAGLISSRSSSISSHHSCTTTTTTTTTTTSSSSYSAAIRPKLPKNRNHFHSHPSPSPRINNSTNTSTSTNHRNYVQRSSVWNILRLGLVTTPPEYALKTRNNNNNNSSNGKNFGSRNSTGSNSNCSSISSSAKSNKKKKQRGLLGGSCKCSLDAVDTVASKVVIIKRTASETDVDALLLQQQDNVEETIKMKKKHLSHHRTFEWLRQLSVEGATDEV